MSPISHHSTPRYTQYAPQVEDILKKRKRLQNKKKRRAVMRYPLFYRRQQTVYAKLKLFLFIYNRFPLLDSFRKESYA